MSLQIMYKKTLQKQFYMQLMIFYHRVADVHIGTISGVTAGGRGHSAPPRRRPTGKSTYRPGKTRGSEKEKRKGKGEKGRKERRKRKGKEGGRKKGGKEKKERKERGKKGRGKERNLVFPKY